MSWEIEVSDEFAEWLRGLTGSRRVKLTAFVTLLESQGHQLDFPYSSQVKGSRFGAMRKLRIQIGGEPWRVFYAFDLRTAYLIMGGLQTGQRSFLRTDASKADSFFEQHLQEI